MKGDAFFTAEAKRRTVEAVRRVESQSAAEIVVAVRTSSSDYRHTDYLVGFAMAVSVLCVLLFAPQTFAIETWPLYFVASFALGTWIGSSVFPLKRLLTSSKHMQAEVARAARATFVDLGVSRTRDRSGVLVYISLLEGRAEVIADIGVDPLLDDDAWKEAVEGIDQAIRRGPDLDQLIAAMDSLAEPLASVLPRREDDINELPDEVQL